VSVVEEMNFRLRYIRRIGLRARIRERRIVARPDHQGGRLMIEQVLLLPDTAFYMGAAVMDDSIPAGNGLRLAIAERLSGVAPIIVFLAGKVAGLQNAPPRTAPSPTGAEPAENALLRSQETIHRPLEKSKVSGLRARTSLESPGRCGFRSSLGPA
jgi:hypothetical protein